MKILKTLFLVLVVHSLVHGQAITRYQLTDIGNNTLKVGAVFNTNGPGPLVQDNSTISLLIPTTLITDPFPTITSIQGGNWSATSIIPNATLVEVCGASATGYDLVQVSTGGQANLGSILAGVAEDLFTITFTGSSTLPIYAYDPTGADPLSACLAGFGVDNVASIDPDGNAGPARTENYSEVPGSEGVVLPIELSAFTAQSLNTMDAQLKWTTASEINSSHFDIERSIQGISWKKIGIVAAAGNSQSNQYYSLIDKNVFDLKEPSTTNFYYRLKMVDIDGYFEYSDVRQVKFESRGLFVGDPFPNPIGLGNSSVQLSVTVEGETNLRIVVYDNQGRIVSTNASPLHIGSNILSIGTGTLPWGVYRIKLTMGNGESFVRELVVQ